MIGWDFVWAFYNGVEADGLKEHIEEQVIGSGWIYSLPESARQEVLRDAPQEILHRVKELKPKSTLDTWIEELNK